MALEGAPASSGEFEEMAACGRLTAIKNICVGLTKISRAAWKGEELL